MITTSSKKEINNQKTSGELIISFTIDEEIIQFNKECELFTGYQRNEVLHRKLSQILLPKESLEQWKIQIDSIRRTLHIGEFNLPIKTKHDQTFLVSWNGILIKDTNGSLRDICLFGTPQKMNNIRTVTSHVIQMITPSDNAQKEPTPGISPIQGAPVKVMPIRYDKRKIVFAHQKETKNDHINLPRRENRDQPLEHIEKNAEDSSEKLDSMNKSLKELTKKYDIVLKRLGDLEKKDWRLEKNDKNIGKHEHLLEERMRRYMKRQKEINNNSSFTEEPLKKNEFTFFSDPFGLRHQLQELATKKQQIETRMSELNIYEKKLMDERKMFNARIEEFCRWREKLELLETAIENRRQELMEQEEHVLNVSPATAQEISASPLERTKISKVMPLDSLEAFEKISQSAAIIQRGILKQINTPFADLLGYTIDEVVEKSFFDLIAQDGLAGVEKYYLDRLKGESVSAYKTVFLTKDENKINVEVSIKQTEFNGEKAEIAVIKNLEKSEPQPINSRF